MLGTSFNFRNFAQERTAELLLMEGSVEASLTGQDNVVRLKPRDRLCYDREAGRDIRKKLNFFSGCTTHSGPFMRYIQQDNPT